MTMSMKVSTILNLHYARKLSELIKSLKRLRKSLRSFKKSQKKKKLRKKRRRASKSNRSLLKRSNPRLSFRFRSLTRLTRALAPTPVSKRAPLSTRHPLKVARQRETRLNKQTSKLKSRLMKKRSLNNRTKKKLTRKSWLVEKKS